MNKKKFAAFCVACVLLLALCACGSGDGSEAREDEAGTEALAALQEELDRAGQENARLEEELAASRESVEALTGELDAALSAADIFFIYRAPDMSKCVPVPDEDGQVIARQLPSDGSKRTVSLGPTVCAQVLLKAEVLDPATYLISDWYLIRYPVADTPVSDFGWVRAEQVREYTAGDKELITYPVTLTEGTVLYEDVACTIEKTPDTSWTQASYYEIIERTDNDVTRLSNGPGEAYVKSGCVVYPEP